MEFDVVSESLFVLSTTLGGAKKSSLGGALICGGAFCFGVSVVSSISEEK